MKRCDVCGTDEIEIGAYGDEYVTKIKTIEVASDTYGGGNYYYYDVCAGCEHEVR